MNVHSFLNICRRNPKSTAARRFDAKNWSKSPLHWLHVFSRSVQQPLASCRSPIALKNLIGRNSVTVCSLLSASLASCITVQDMFQSRLSLVYTFKEVEGPDCQHTVGLCASNDAWREIIAVTFSKHIIKTEI